MEPRAQYNELITDELDQYKANIAVEFEKHYREIHYQDFYDLMQKITAASNAELGGFWIFLGYENNNQLAKKIEIKLDHGDILSESRFDAPAPATPTTSWFEESMRYYMPSIHSFFYSASEQTKENQPKVILNAIIAMINDRTFDDSSKVKLMDSLIKQLPSYDSKLKLETKDFQEISREVGKLYKKNKSLCNPKVTYQQMVARPGLTKK